MKIGGFKIGGGSLDGRIAALQTVPTVSGAEVSWIHKDAPEGGQHRFAVALDGDLVAVLPSGQETLTLDAIPDGVHRVEVRPIRFETSRIPDMHGDQYGRRAFLRWPASVSPDCRAYKVYWDGGTGTVDYSAALAIVSGARLHPRFFIPPDYGDGVGCLTIVGDWTGAECNALFAVEVTSGGFRHNASGSWSASREFSEGQELELANGLRVAVCSPRSFYHVGDTFYFRVGPAVEWQSPDLTLLPEWVPLTVNTFRFGVKAFDAAGNPSDPIEEKSVAIVRRPDPVENVVATWDGEKIRVAWELPPMEGNAYFQHHVFSNWSRNLNTLKDEILFAPGNADLAYIALAEAFDTFVEFSPPVPGRYLLCVRSTDGSLFSDNVNTVEIDTADLPTGTALNRPEGLEVTPTAGGTFRLSWFYPYADGDALTEFRVYANNDPDGPDFGAPVLVLDGLSLDDYSDTGVVSFEISTESLPPFSAVTYFTVRASDGTVETINSELVPGTPDADPPEFVGALKGVSN